MRNRRRERLILATIVLVAALLRFYKLGSNPPSLYWDEASLGYNAYSILKTGHDEHGEFLPLTRFIAFGDYKPPGYIYAAVPSIAIFGLTEFAVRFPSAFAGILTVLVTYFLVKELFGEKSLNIKHQTLNIGVIAAFLLAISPWHLQFSRGAFEANLATFFSIAGVYFFLKGREKGIYWILSALSFSLSMYTFNTHRVFVPILIAGLMVIYRKHLRHNLKYLLISAALLIALLSPLVPYLQSREGQLRFREVTFLLDVDPIITANDRIAREGNSMWAKIVHNRRVQFAMEFLKHYGDHFRANFLFFSGDVNPRLGTRDQGLLYIADLPFILAGLYFLVKRKDTTSALILFWWLSAVLPAATARETPHALRTLNVLPVPQIIAAFGIMSLYGNIKKKKFFLSLLITSYSILVFSYLHTYYVHYPKTWAASWQYGYKQLVEYVSPMKEAYDRIYVTSTYGRPYIYFLFYLKYPPQEYWMTKTAERDWFGFWTVESFDRFIFRDPPGKDPSQNEKWLVVSDPGGLPEKATKLLEITFPNGDTAFEIGEE